MNVKILVINGPNLNMLGIRDRNQYGSFTLDELNEKISKKFQDISFDFFQSNHEGEIVDKLQTYSEFNGIIINPGALTHYSYAIRDCIETIPTDVIEVHISNVDNREEFRKESVITPVCIGKISGLKEYSYILGVEYFLKDL
ncbi:MAG: type II 3-dehydroquinate dehydratase [Bacillota bacterium]|nr:type II 3-dehydroquinate dehydratase [Bacillota bacterium]